jgi:transcription elongation GreA/GreB family factor
MDKKRLIDQLIREVRGEISVMKRAADASREAATHEESRAENDKDTRGLEAAYLASGQVERVKSLERVANALEFLPLRVFAPGDPVAAGALVELERDGDPFTAFIAIEGGGLETELDGRPILVVSPRSPLGQALVGKCAGDDFEVRERSYAVLSVS